MTLQGIEILIAFVRQSGKLGLPPLKRTLYWREYPEIRLWQAHGFAAPAGKYLVMEDVYEDTEEEYIRFCAQRDIEKAVALKILQRMYSRLKRLRIKGTRVDLEPIGTFYNKDDRLCFVPSSVEWHEAYYGLPIVQVEPFVHSAERKAVAARHAQDKKPHQRSTISYDPRQERLWMVALSFCLIAILIMGYALLQSIPLEAEGSYFIKDVERHESVREVLGLAHPIGMNLHHRTMQRGGDGREVQPARGPIRGRHRTPNGKRNVSSKVFGALLVGMAKLPHG